MPGDRVRVVERRRVADDAAGPRGRAFLKLEATPKAFDDSDAPAAPERACENGPENDTENGGWVMEHHPSNYEPILVREPPM